MPLWTPWLTAPPTSGSAAVNTYLTIPAQQVLLSQTATNSNALAVALYNNSQTSASTWHGLGACTTSTGSNTVCWSNNINTIVWEDDLNQAQYIALAQGRVEYTREQLIVAEAQARATLEAHQRQVAEDRARFEREQAEGAERRKAALAKSRELLLQHLTPRQRKTFEENAWFVVQGGKSKKTYRIRTTGYTGNIEEMRDGHVTHRLCGHLRGGYALHDHHVAQKISLEYDEEAFVRLCNRHAA